MYPKYLLLTLALIPSIAYTMQGDTPEKRIKKHKEEMSSAPLTPALIVQEYKKEKELSKKRLAQANHEPVATYITSMLTPITFHKKTQSFFKFLKDHKTNHFGDTPIIEMNKDYGEYSFCTFQHLGVVSNVEDPNEIAKMTADQKAVYISNTSKIYPSPSSKKYINMGTILLWNELTTQESSMQESITYAVNQLLAHLLVTQQPKKAEDKNKSEKDSDNEIVLSEQTLSTMSKID